MIPASTIAVFDLPPPNGPDTVFDTAEAAHYLRCTPGYLKKLRQTGEGPAFHRLFKRKGIIYRREDLDLWQSHRRYSSTAEYPEAIL